MPLDICLHPAVACLGEADELQQLGSLGAAASRTAQPLVQGQQLVRRVPAGEAEELRQVAEPAAAPRASRH